MKGRGEAHEELGVGGAGAVDEKRLTLDDDSALFSNVKHGMGTARIRSTYYSR